jgi:hypothetical protein
MDQVRFGAGLFGTGGNLLTQGYGGQTAALDPYKAYLAGATGLEGLGQQSLDMGINLGAKGQSTAGANALLQGYGNAAQSMGAANAYNPFATALVGASQNPALMRSAAGMFGQQPFSGTAIMGPTSMSQLDYASLSGY